MSARSTIVRAGFVAFTLAASCSSNESAGPTERSSTTSLPCDVDDVLERNCRSCHSSPPKFGAPVALVSADDLAAPSKSDPSKSVATRVGERIHDPVAPMPQGAKLSAADMATLDTWIAGGAKAIQGTCADAGSIADAGPVGPDFLPCPEEERTTFLAHGDTLADPYPLAADAGNLYMCFSWKAPWSGTHQATAFAPVIDDARAVHHWILYETATPQIDGGAKKCAMPFDAKFLQGWAPGGTNRVLPDDIGLALPSSDRWLILQVHYWNVAGYTDVRDRSGVAMCTTSNLRPKTAVVSTLGSANIDLPPRSTGTVVTGRCTPAITEPIHVLASGPHMHGRGRRLRTQVLRGGSESAIETLVDEPSFDFESQRSYPSSLVVQPGDVLRTECTYDNPTETRVTFGEKTEDEMCFNFVTVWPAPGLFNEGGRATQRCIDR
ncbi:MAG: hypothetical protein KF819_31110 [Labilithrix sp.]|nr:hypothetical protein [Labilithrix sp.]